MNRSTDCLMNAECLPDFSNRVTRGMPMQTGKRSLLKTISLWHERSKQRRELRALARDNTILKDIGLSRYDVQREARKHFWNK